MTVVLGLALAAPLVEATPAHASNACASVCINLFPGASWDGVYYSCLTACLAAKRCGMFAGPCSWGFDFCLGLGARGHKQAAEYCMLHWDAVCLGITYSATAVPEPSGPFVVPAAAMPVLAVADVITPDADQTAPMCLLEDEAVTDQWTYPPVGSPWPGPNPAIEERAPVPSATPIPSAAPHPGAG